MVCVIERIHEGKFYENINNNDEYSWPTDQPQTENINLNP